MENETKYNVAQPKKADDLYTCPKCGASNIVHVTDSLDGRYEVLEADTVCRQCFHADYWAYGFYESLQEENDG